MGKQKTIFDLFRQEGEQFSSKPSSDAWSKLERKLEGKKEVVRVRRIGWWTIAASFIALMGTVFILQKNSNRSASEAVAVNTMTEKSSAFYVEDLVYSDAESDFEKEWQVSNQYRALFADYKPDFLKNENLAFNDASKIRPRINEKPQINRKNQLIADNTMLDISTEEKTIRNNEKRNELERQSTEALVMVQKEERIAAMEPESFNSYNQEEDASSISTKMDVPTASIKKSKSVGKKVNRTSDLQWLVGTWEQKRAEMKSVEKWVADSSNSIWGTGYLLQEDDTIFTENMCIKQINDKIYFFQNIDTVKEQTKFVLTSSTNNNWNFTNSEGAPKNLILSNVSDSNYKFEIQEIAPTQTHFLRQRNILQSNNAFRQMNKVD